MIFIFLNLGLVGIGEAGTIEDENQEPRNIKDILKEQGQRWSKPFTKGVEGFL